MTAVGRHLLARVGKTDLFVSIGTLVTGLPAAVGLFDGVDVDAERGKN